MELYIKLGLCFIPLAAVLCFSIFKITSFRLSFAAWAAASGFAALVPIIALQYAVKRFFPLSAVSLGAAFFNALLFNGLIEEGVKTLFLFLIPAKNATKAAFTAAALIAGTTVGSFEALVYGIAGVHYSVLRLFTAVILHALCAGLSSVFVYSTKTARRRIAPLLSAVVCHGVYNFFAGFNGFLWYFSLSALLFALIRLRFFYTD